MGDFDSFAAARWPGLVRTAYLMGATAHDAEDHAQAALTKVWSNWARVQASDNPEAYTLRILINTVHKARRRRWMGETPTGEVLDPGVSHVDDRDAALDLRRSLSALPPDQRAVLVLRFLHDKSEAEIADILGVPAGTVKSRSARGISALRAHMSEETL